jgi:MFS family permease
MKENPLSASGFRLEQILPSDVKRATVVAFFAWVFAVYDFILFGTLLPEIGKHYNWDAAAQAEIATLVAIGTAVIAFAIGPLLDRLGRKAGLLWTVAGAAVCSGLTVVGGAMGQVPLVLIRSLSGLGYAEETVNATYLNELYSAANDPKLNRNKGFIYSLVQGGWPIGALIASGLTALLLPRIGWQGCFIFATFPAIVIFFMTRRLKESPQFLLHKRIKQLREAGQDGEARSLASTHSVDYEEHARAGLAEAFRGSALRATLVLGGGILLNWSAIQVFSVLGTTVLTQVHNVSFENSLLILVLSNVIGYLRLSEPRFHRRQDRAAQHARHRLDVRGARFRGHAVRAEQRGRRGRPIQPRAVLPDRTVFGGAVFHRRELSHGHSRHRQFDRPRDGPHWRDPRGRRRHLHAQPRRRLAARGALVRRGAVFPVRRADPVRAARRSRENK